MKTKNQDINRMTASIREIQKTIIKIKKDKGMIAKMSILSDLINHDHEWRQDLIEKMRGE